MGARQGFVITKIEPAPTLPSPNAVVPQITVELRVYWPQARDNEAPAAELVLAAAEEAVLRLQQHYHQYPPVPTHRHLGRYCLDCTRNGVADVERGFCTFPAVSLDA